MLAGIGIIVGAYLFGSLPYTVALARAYGLDPLQEEDLHIALWRKIGILEGASGVGVDLTKGVVVILVGFGFGLPIAIVALSGVAVVMGQMWPVFTHFDGEKGNTIGMAVLAILLLAYQAYPVLLSFIPMAIGGGMRLVSALYSRKGSVKERIRFHATADPIALGLPVGMIIGFAVAPLISWLSGQLPAITLFLLLVFLAILVRRLTADLGVDLKDFQDIKLVMLNRLLFDCSYLRRA